MLAFETASVPAAREFVRRELKHWRGDRNVAELLTSELVTNAIVHAHSECRLSVDVDPTRVRVEVRDSSPVLPPPPKPPDPEATSGRGLVLVDTLATRWGTERARGGKRVWFELRGAAPSP
jgi:anti-sigma regulatory factor (Ser/Thr protein kinase)